MKILKMNNEAEETLPKTCVIRRESNALRLLEQSRIRIYCIATFFLVSFLAISCVLIQITILNHKETSQTAVITPAENKDSDEIKTTSTILRGDIVDRNGVVIATTLTTQSLFANPNDLMNAKDAAKKIAKTFPELDEKDLYKKLSRKSSFIWIKRNLTPKEQYAANNLGIPGLYFQEEQKRVYPDNNLLSHVIGFVGLDNSG
ncbi:MAG: hypothetical protein WCJ33_07740, partial [Pseudomonadota bacterium]